MCHYTHLTPFEREKILFFLAEGKSITEIAHLLKRSKSAISRKFRRNAAPAGQPMPYCSLTAQALYKQRGEACRPHKRLAYVPLHAYIQTCILEYHWSLEEIIGRIQLEYGCRLVNDLPRYLRRTAESVRNFSEVVVGKQGKACLVTLVDRKSRYLLGGKAMSKTVAAVNKVMCEALSEQPHLSVTPDRGKEFSKHAQLKRELKRVTFYFPAPHHPWERGTNENTNGLLREFFPKGKDITDTLGDYIQRKYHELNLRPRKCLGYKTPYEVYFSRVLHLA